MPPVILYISILLLSFILTAAGTRILIPILKSRKMGQKILDIGPRWHKSKEGTPTMGGLAFIFASFPAVAAGCILMRIIYGEWYNILPLIITYFYAVINGLIGILDDYVKLTKKQNEGLSAKQKYLLQLAIAGLYLFLLSLTGTISTVIFIPFTEIGIDFGIFYYVIALILLTGIVNSSNLADGIDGLLSTYTSVIAAFFSVIAFVMYSVKPDESFPMIILSSVCLGLCLGFLVYNFHPAKVFMGDTGSLFLGGLIVGLAFLSGMPIIILIAGIIYLIESASVIIQVTYFKLTNGKRIFLMAPIHHHFEKLGWSEIKICSVFSLVAVISCVIAYFGFRIV